MSSDIVIAINSFYCNSNIISLQDLILNNIRDNFSYYTTSYRSTENKSLKRNLLFLQRRYTQTLFDMLQKDGKLEKEHLDFLLNKHLVKLDISFLLLFLRKESILEKVIPIALNLHELLCNNKCNISDARFLLKRLIPYSSNVKRIVILFFCNDKLLKLIASSCPDLIELDIQGSAVTGKGLKALCTNSDGLNQVNCPITSLNLLETQVKVGDVAFLLRNLSTLEKVDYKELTLAIELSSLLDIESNISKNTLKYNLRNLIIGGYRNSSDLAKVISFCSRTCPKLKTLSVDIFNSKDFKIISSFPCLENLKVSANRWLFSRQIEIVNDFFVGGKLIKNLHLSFVSISLPTLVENCPNLETLILSNTNFRELDKNPVTLLNRLHRLEFESFQIYQDTESLMKLFSLCPKLETLSFKCCFDQDTVKEVLKFSLNCNLKHLLLTESNVVYDSLQQFIIKCNSISTLTVRHCKNIDLYRAALIKASTGNRKLLIYLTENDFVSSTDDEYFDDSDLDSYDSDDLIYM